ncbi:MAG: hypothetical protein ABI234_19025 [Ktedonobacteraceae bacterium]
MHDEQIADANNNNNQAVSSREQHLVEQVHKQLQDSQQIYGKSLKQIVPLLPEKFKEMAIHTVAEQFVTIMKMHLLSIAATFYQGAANENIDAEDRDETLQDVEADVYTLMEMIHRLTVNTPETLARLGTITTSIQDLSQCDNAEEAQRWLYNLPMMYQTSLEREHLIRKEFSIVITPPASTSAEQHL